MKFSSPIFFLIPLLLCLFTLGHAEKDSSNGQTNNPVIEKRSSTKITSTAQSTSASQEEKTSKTERKTANPQSNREDFITFTPPAGWVMADANMLPPTVKVMVVGKAYTILPPSMNLATEPNQGTLKQFLKKIKKMNEANGHPWKDLGTIRTKAGTASLSQVDFPSKWGDMRMMHVILIRNEHVYILSASALKTDFPLFYNDFFASLRSLRIVNDPYEVIIDTAKKTKLQSAVNQLIEKWNALIGQEKGQNPQTSMGDLRKKLFYSEHFQNTIWIPFLDMIGQEYQNELASWKELFLQKIEDRLLISDTIKQNS